NEINRLIVPGTLVKKAMKGELPLFEAAQNLQEEIMMMMPEEVGTEPLEQEKHLLKNAKKIVLLGAGLAAQKYMQKLENEQEILSNLADMAAAVYNMEAAILRTEKAINKDGADKHQQKLLYTQVYVQEAINKIEPDAKEILSNLADMAAAVYNIEAAIIRTEKAINKDGADKHQQKLLYTQVYVQEAFNKIEADAKEILIAVEEGDNLRMMLSSLRKLTR